VPVVNEQAACITGMEKTEKLLPANWLLG